MSDNYKASFEVDIDDEKYNSKLGNMKAEARVWADTVMAEARRIYEGIGGDSGSREAQRHIQRTISEARKVSANDLRSQELEINEKYDRTLSSMNKYDPQYKVAEKNRETELAALRKDARENTTQIDLLSRIFDELRSYARESLVTDKKAAETQMRAIERGEVKDATDKDVVEALYQRSIVGKDEEARPEKEKTWWEVTKGIIASDAIKWVGNKAAQVTGAFASATDEEQVISKLWGAVPFVGGALETASSRHIELEEKRDREFNRLKATTGVGGMIDSGNKIPGTQIKLSSTDQSDELRKQKEEAVNAYLDSPEVAAEVERQFKAREASGLYGSSTPIGGREGKAVEAGQQMYKNIDRKSIKEEVTRDTVNQLTSDYDQKIRAAEVNNAAFDAYMRSQFSYEAAGYSQEEFLPVANMLAKSSKTGTGIAQRTRSFIDLTKGRGLADQDILGIEEIRRFDSGGHGLSNISGLEQMVGRMESVFMQSGIISQGDRSREASALSYVTQFSNYQLGRGLDSINMVNNAQMLGAFEKLGGQFGTDSTIMQGIDKSLATPSNDYQQAMNYKIYQQTMSKKGKPTSYVDFMKWQEKGMSAEGLMSGTMDTFKDLYGDTEWAEIAFKERFGMRSWDEASRLASGNPADFAFKEGDEKAIAVQRRSAAGYTSEREKSQAEITNAFIDGMWEGLGTVFDKVGDALADKIRSMGIPGGGVLARLLEGLASK